MEAQDKIAVVNKYAEAFEKTDISIIKELYADDATLEDPVGTADVLVGIDAIIAFYEVALQGVTKFELSGSPRCAGDSVAFPFCAHTSDGKINVIDVFEFNNEGKITSMKAYWGPENFMA